MFLVGPDPVALPQPPRGHALEAVHQPRHRDLRRVGDEQVHMIIVTIELHQTRAEVGADIVEDLTEQAEMAPVSTPRRYLVTKTKCRFSAETTCRPRR